MEAKSTTRSSRLSRTLAATVGVLTLASLGLVGTTTAAGAAGTTAVKATAQAEARQFPCRGIQLLRNRHFEQPRVFANGGNWQLFGNPTPGLGWRSQDGRVELWRGLGTPHAGRQHAEINAVGNRNTIWQAVRVRPRSIVHWSVWVKARDYNGALNVDVTQVRINGRPQRNMVAGDLGWRYYEGFYRVPVRTRLLVLSFQSIRHHGPAGFGNLIDTASLIQCGRF